MQQGNQMQSHKRERKLDQERAASMADEGGVSGAIVDARERGEDLAIDAELNRRWRAKQILALAGLAAGFGLLVFGLRRS